MLENDMSLADNVKRLRLEKGWSQGELAKRVGVRQPTITHIETGDSKNTKHIFKLAKVLGVTVAELDPDLGKEPPGVSSIITETASNDFSFPIHAAAEGGSGALIINWDPVDYRARPAPLVNVKGGYGIFVVGDSMAPAYKPGQIALVNPFAPAVAGDDVVLFKADGGNSTEALIKTLVKVTSQEWHVAQYNPPKSFTLLKSEWPQCQLVVGRYNR